ncbi:hypothetical protein [Marimonas arenosa]|uniref:hypothetical protein n=1 Tax=Marimonas arenosa TaxID=1795305 RepID=UPI0027D29EC1|nr:hypothetical protein [Marimonas arenosa]
MDSVTTIGTTGVQITCDDLLLWFNQENRSYAPPRLRVTVQPIGKIAKSADGGMNAEQAGNEAKAVLATTLALLARDLGADGVNWLSKDALIPADSFIEAALPITPRRVQTEEVSPRPVKARLAPGDVILPEIGSFPVAPRRVSGVEAQTPRPTSAFGSRQIGLDFSLKLRELRHTEEQIAEAIHAEVSLPLRITAWIMTILIGIFSAPLAWVLFAFNLNRGGDFRVTANVLAATAGLSLLHAAGATQVFLDMIFK